MITSDTQHKIQPNHKHCFLPNLIARNPAPPEETKAPRVMSEEISCWRSVVRFHPIGVFGARNPKICSLLVRGLIEGSERGTWRKPGIAWRPPMRPKSRPYWNAPRITTALARKTRRFAEMVVFASVASVEVDIVIKTIMFSSAGNSLPIVWLYRNSKKNRKDLEDCI